MITIRRMTASDAAAVSNIVSECQQFIAGPDGLSDAQLETTLRTRCRPEHMLVLVSRYQCLVAQKETDLAGMIALGGSHIEELFVLPVHHRKGIGGALFRQAEQLIQQAGHRRITVTTTGYGRPFYEAMGMQVAGTQRVAFGPLVGRNLVLLEKTIALGVSSGA